VYGLAGISGTSLTHMLTYAQRKMSKIPERIKTHLKVNISFKECWFQTWKQGPGTLFLSLGATESPRAV